MAKNTGTVIQVVGPVLDIRFADGCLPDLLSAIEVPNGDKIVVSTQKTGAVTGAVDKKYLSKM